MYTTRPPSGHFNPSIPPTAQMPTPLSPPACLKAVIDRLNKTSSRTRPTGQNTNPRPLATFQDLQASRHNPQHHASSEHRSAIPALTATPNSPSLPQHAVKLIENHTQLSTILSPLDLSNSKVEIHIHVHPSILPSFRPLHFYSERLKRKRDDEEDEIMGDSPESLERRVKKIKLSHDAEVGNAGKRRGRGRGRGKNGEGPRTRSARMRPERLLRSMDSRGRGAESWRC